MNEEIARVFLPQTRDKISKFEEEIVLELIKAAYIANHFHSESKNYIEKNKQLLSEDKILAKTTTERLEFFRIEVLTVNNKVEEHLKMIKEYILANLDSLSLQQCKYAKVALETLARITLTPEDHHLQNYVLMNIIERLDDRIAVRTLLK